MRHIRLLKKALTISATVTIVATSCLAADYKEPITGMEFVHIEGGRFVMGDISGRDETAIPAHRVTVSDFYIGVYEVTFDQYDAYCKEAKKDMPDDNSWGRGTRPVINVSWHDAIAFAEWLSKKSGKTMRLPTEAEWEYAARAGTGTRFWWGNQNIKGLANCYDCGGEWSGKSTAPVGSFRGNPFGLHDMNGNVYEWVQDSKFRNYEGAPTDGSAWVSDTEKKKMSRSGAWFMPGIEMSSYARSWDPVDSRNNTIGMRLVMEP